MYILTIDIGNTTISAALFAEEECIGTMRLPSDASWEQNALTAEFQQFLTRHLPRIKDLNGTVLTSVVPDCTLLVQNAIYTLTRHEALVLTAGMPCGINLACYDTEHLGTDRIVDMAAAASMYNGPIAIWDLGTATTLSVIDEHRVFLGGMISPGIELGLRALHEHTAQLPLVEPKACPSLLGNDTESNMRSGSVASTGLTISATIDYLRRRYSFNNLYAIITGGHAEYVLPWIAHEDVIYVPDLQFRGMLAIWQMQNRGY